MVDYTLSSYKEALNTYDGNVENLKNHSSKEIDDLLEVFNRTQKDVQNDQFLSLSEKNRMLEKRQEGFDRLKKEIEDKFSADLDAELKNKEDFIAQNGGLDYHCFTVLNEISKLKEERLGELSQELAKKQEELACLQAEVETKQHEVNDLKGDLDSIQSATLHEAFFELDVLPRIKKVEADLEALVEGVNNNYNLSQDFVSRIIRYLTKECKRQKGLLNYEGGKLQLSFDTVVNRTKGENPELKVKVIDILTDGGFVVSKMGASKLDLKENNTDINTTFTPMSVRSHGSIGSNELYLREMLLQLDKNDIQGRINIFKELGFSFANEGAFIRQVETARGEGVDLIEDIDKWIQLYLIKPGGIEPRTGDDKKEYLKISLDCRQRNPRILMTMNPTEGMKILCVAPHVDYDNILRGQTKNYFQTWKGNWIKKGKQGRKTGRA